MKAAASRVEPGAMRVTELDRKPSSCPYLYGWNGERFEFITDFMGAGEMGAWAGPGLYNTPDPDEYVRIRGDQLRERDGRYEVALGYSRRVGASAMLVADLVRFEEMTENDEVNLAEIGLRYATTPQSVVSAGVGFGFGDESPDVRLTLGVQYEF